MFHKFFQRLRKTQERLAKEAKVKSTGSNTALIVVNDRVTYKINNKTVYDGPTDKAPPEVHAAIKNMNARMDQSMAQFDKTMDEMDKTMRAAFGKDWQ